MNNKKKEKGEKKDNDKIKGNEEIKDKKEKEEKVKEEKRKRGLKNAVIYFDHLFYDFPYQKLTSKYNPIEKIKGTFECGYKNNINKINIISNEYYYLLEINLFCIYLSLIEKFKKKANEFDGNKEKNSNNEEEKENQEEEYEEEDEKKEEEKEEKFEDIKDDEDEDEKEVKEEEKEKEDENGRK